MLINFKKQDYLYMNYFDRKIVTAVFFTAMEYASFYIIIHFQITF